MKKIRAVEIRCQGADSLKLDNLLELQGNLKELNTNNYNRLRRQIIKHGFCEPLTIWKHRNEAGSSLYYLANGHQRLRTLKQMRDDGFHIPKIPVNYVEAETIEDAKRILLSLASNYGEVTNDGLYEFIIDAGIMPQELISDFRLPEINENKFLEEYFDLGGEPPEEKPETFNLKLCCRNQKELKEMESELTQRGFDVERL